MFGVFCRLLWYTSLAYDASNTAMIEFSTPRSSEPQAILFCFTDTSFAQNSADIALQSLQIGGDPWLKAAAGRELVSASADGLGYVSSFATGASDTSTVLDSDPYYARSYTVNRYDDLVADQNGLPLPKGLLQTIEVSNSSKGTSNGHCISIEGPWQANSRYQLTLAFNNPPAPAQLPSAPVPPPSIWMAPLSYIAQHNSSGRPAGRAVQVRGSKQGQLCSIRAQAAGLLPGMFSACHEAAARGWVAAGEDNTTACLSALRQGLLGDAALVSVFPFNAPPVSDASIGSTAEVACAAGSLLRPHLGGECIDCTHANQQGSKCVCWPGYVEQLVGPTACGARIHPNGNASSAADLAAQLCTAYSSAYDKIMKGELSDRLVHTMYLAAFSKQAAYLLDWTSIYESNITFWQQHVTDERMPSSPSRRTGVGPNCTACMHGKFKDIYTKQQVAVRDDRFLAVQTLRLIGYLLNTGGHPCPALWDPDDPWKNMYGRYDKAMCTN